MRGLDARIKMARYRIAVAINGGQPAALLLEDVHAMRQDAYESALRQGQEDAEQGFTEAPEMIRRDFALLPSWEKGYYEELEFAAMRTCSGCQNSDGHPCMSHD